MSTDPSAGGAGLERAAFWLAGGWAPCDLCPGTGKISTTNDIVTRTRGNINVILMKKFSPLDVLIGHA